MNEITQKQEEAILKIAYVFASLDKEPTEAEKKTLRDMAKQFPWFKPGEQTTSAFLDDAISTSNRILQRKDFCAENEYIDTFASEVAADCSVVMKSEYASRKAFALWIEVCMSEDYSEFLKKAVRKLQGMFVKKEDEWVSRHFNPAMAVENMFCPGEMIRRVGDLFDLFKSGSNVAECRLEPTGKTITVPMIPDEYLQKVEERLSILGTFAVLIETTRSQDEKAKYQAQYKIIETELRNLIETGIIS
ncbi:MAG: hypothetical protein IKQ16_07325 [Lentisphaeria bacterium]|nr:hypothetical protein [Lentisphaeria bacterium]